MNSYSRTGSSGGLGSVWQPRQSNFMVGRDGFKTTSTEFQQADNTRKLTDTTEIRDNAVNRLKADSTLARLGLSNQRDIKSTLVDGTLTYSQNVLSRNGTSISLETTAGGSRSLVIMTAADKQEAAVNPGFEPERIALTDDMRISIGNNGEVNIARGQNALNGGTLKASGANELLVRVSDINVEAGKGSTVLNLSDKSGTFSGGSDVTYLGSYNNATVLGGSGSTNFEGYFTNSLVSTLEQLSEGSMAEARTFGTGKFTGIFSNSTVNAGEANDKFSGTFNASTINGGNGKNVFEGTFLGGSQVLGGDASDHFTGLFINSKLDAGEGNNFFGDATSYGFGNVDAGFINAEVVAGSGKDTFDGVAHASRIDLGDGDNTVGGVYTESFINTGAGNDQITIQFSTNSEVNTGDGDDAVRLATANSTFITTNGGMNTVDMGLNRGDRKRAQELYGGGHMADAVWYTATQDPFTSFGHEHGEQIGNFVNASSGNNIITFHNGASTQRVFSGDINTSQLLNNDQTVQENTPENNAQYTQALLQNAAQAQESITAPLASPAEVTERGRVLAGDAPLTEGIMGTYINAGTGENISLKAVDRNGRDGHDFHNLTNLMRKGVSSAYSFMANLS